MNVRAALIALALVALLALPAAPAQAGTYTVSACASGNGNGANASWTAFNVNGAGPWYDGQCTNGQGLTSAVTGGTAPDAETGWQFAAPQGTTITGYRMAYQAQWSGSPFVSELDSGFDGAFLNGPCFSGYACGYLFPSPYSAWGWTTVSGAGAWQKLRLVTYTGVPGSGSATTYAADIYVTLSETGKPTLGYTGGSVLSGGWIGGDAALTYDATDASGIRRAQLWLDGSRTDVVADTGDRACDFARISPCANVSGGSLSFDTHGVANGAHTVRLSVENAAGNWTDGPPEQIYVSNEPPAAPTITVDGDGAWQGGNSWTLRVTNPPAGDPAPAVAALVRVCRSDGSDCSTSAEPISNGAPGAANAISGSFGVTSPGEYTASVWERDAAGNASAADASAPVTLRWDAAAPGGASIGSPDTVNGWLDAAEATTYSPSLAIAAGAAIPASGIAGYAVTTDGTEPGTKVSVPAAAGAALPPPSGGWPEGTDTIEARAISGAGVASPDVATLRVKVDRTPPTIDAEGYGAPAPAWQPGPVTVRLVATDSLSGMGAADDSDPIGAGGYIAYTVDTGARTTVRGGAAALTVAAPGRHWITFDAYDVAGNVSPERTIYIDVGSPSEGSFNPAGFFAQTVNPRTTFTAASGFGINCPHSATLVPSADTYVDQASPDAPAGSATTLMVRSNVGANARTLLDFALPSANGCAVRSATLRLYSEASTAGRTLDVYRAGSAWNEATASWSTRPGPTGTPAAAQLSGSGWQAIDVTAQLQDIYRYGDDGLLVRDAAEDADPAVGQSFGAREGAAVEAPQLVVDYG